MAPIFMQLFDQLSNLPSYLINRYEIMTKAVRIPVAICSYSA